MPVKNTCLLGDLHFGERTGIQLHWLIDGMFTMIEGWPDCFLICFTQYFSPRPWDYVLVCGEKNQWFLSESFWPALILWELAKSMNSSLVIPLQEHRKLRDLKIFVGFFAGDTENDRRGTKPVRSDKPKCKTFGKVCSDGVDFLGRYIEISASVFCKPEVHIPSPFNYSVQLSHPGSFLNHGNLVVPR